jgi:uncharacterized protein (DUF1778 family)
MSMPTFTMRIPSEDYEALQAISLLEECSMSDFAREAVVAAVKSYISSQSATGFQERDRTRQQQALATIRAHGSLTAEVA